MNIEKFLIWAGAGKLLKARELNFLFIRTREIFYVNQNTGIYKKTVIWRLNP